MSSDQGIGTWVPNLFYDLIARVVPGFAVSATAATVWAGTGPSLKFFKEVINGQKSPDLSTTLIILIAFAISYVAAFVVNGVYRSVVSVIDRAREQRDRDVSKKENNVALRDRFAKLTDICIRPIDQWLLPPDHKFRAIQYDFIKLKDASVGNRITKLRAEVELLSVLQTGWLLSALLALPFCEFSIGFVLILACASLQAAKLTLHHRLLSSLINHTRLLNFDEWQEQEAKSDAPVGESKL